MVTSRDVPETSPRGAEAAPAPVPPRTGHGGAGAPDAPDAPGGGPGPAAAPGPRAPRRRRRLLTEEAILTAALDLVDATGELTMAALAARLGSTASSIYHHVPGRGAIVERLRVRIGAAIAPPGADGPWDVELVRFVHAYREAFARHPRLIPLLTAQPVSGAEAVEVYEAVMALLDRAGVPVHRHLVWTSVLDNFVLGSALDLAAPDEVWQVGDGHRPTPRLDAAVAASPHGRDRADAAFTVGVQALVAGIRDAGGRHRAERDDEDRCQDVRRT